MKKTQQLLTPRYKPLQWEIEEAEEYARKSFEKFSFKKEKRDSDTKLYDAFVGRIGETAFYEMLPKDLQAQVKQWSSLDGDIGKDYDFLIGKNPPWKTIDIKTTQNSDRIPNHFECNFVINIKTVNDKKNYLIPMCDYYVQMFWDGEYCYFVGAIDYPEIEKYQEGEKKWYKCPPGMCIIKNTEMNYTKTFLDYFDEKHKKY